MHSWHCRTAVTFVQNSDVYMVLPDTIRPVPSTSIDQRMGIVFRLHGEPHALQLHPLTYDCFVNHILCSVCVLLHTHMAVLYYLRLLHCLGGRMAYSVNLCRDGSMIICWLGMLLGQSYKL